ncbi:MAG TPA: hypothetical protein V6C81_26035 [Planktothrix sp.]|jgi:serine/threonine protein kinase
MFWPTPQDYNEAIQISDSFDDPDLRKGKPELNSIGLPRPITGAFASVYRIHGAGKDWAVKCFLRDVPGQQERYSQIGKFVHTDDLPYTIDFEYVERGVRVHDKWYPILKMEWVEGPTVNQYVLQNLKNSGKIAGLAERFHAMTNRLHDEGIAHGDLQHGNMLIVKDDIVLVDYDGMFVPSLMGEHSNELGHRNYQHPLRAAENFGAYLDDFSEWSIYVSLKCLSIDPDLWYSLGADDDCMLFKQADYLKPEKSRAFSILEYHRSDEIRALAKNFRLCMHKSMTDVPQLRTVFDDISLLPPVEIPILASPIKQSRAMSFEETVGAREIPAGVALAEEGLTLVVSDTDVPMEIAVPSNFVVTHRSLPAKVESSNNEVAPAQQPAASLPGQAYPYYFVFAPKNSWLIAVVGFFILVVFACLTTNGTGVSAPHSSAQNSYAASLGSADTQFAEKNYQAAADQYKQALNDSITAYGSSNVHTAHVMLSLAKADLQLKEWDAASDNATTAGKTYSNAYGFGINSPEYVESMLTQVQSDIGKERYEDAGNQITQLYDQLQGASILPQFSEQMHNDLQLCVKHITGNTISEKHFLIRAPIYLRALSRTPEAITPTADSTQPAP